MTKIYCVMCAANGGKTHTKGCPCLGDEAQGLAKPPVFEAKSMDEMARAQKRLFHDFNHGSPETRAAAEAKLRGFDVVA